MVQSEDVNSKGLQKRGGEHSSKENCVKDKGRALERLGGRQWERGKAERQTATLLSPGRGRAGNGAHVLWGIDSCILNLKQSPTSQELGKCPFGH